MREIKFRGIKKNIAHEQFPELYLKRKMPFVYGIGVFRDGFNTWIVQEGNHKCFADIKGEIVHPETVGEYIEYYDYYEGDVIENEVEKYFGKNKMLCAYHGIVEFKNYQFQIHCIEDNHYYSLDKFTGCVVGNIYDNPELLEL